MSDEAALLKELENVIEESRKLRVRLALLQKQLDFYPLLQSSAPESKSLPEPAPSPYIAKSTLARRKTETGGEGIFAGLRTIPPNPEPVRLLPTSSLLPVRDQRDPSRDEAPQDMDQLELVTALAVGV